MKSSIATAPMTKREAGSKGGSASTPAKAEAVKRNGAKGGRPVEFCADCRLRFGREACGLSVEVVRADGEVMQVSCTKESGHEGEHVACGVTNHALHRWLNYDVPTCEAMKAKFIKRNTKYGPSVRSVNELDDDNIEI